MSDSHVTSGTSLVTSQASDCGDTEEKTWVPEEGGLYEHVPLEACHLQIIARRGACPLPALVRVRNHTHDDVRQGFYVVDPSYLSEPNPRFHQLTGLNPLASHIHTNPVQLYVKLALLTVTCRVLKYIKVNLKVNRSRGTHLEFHDPRTGSILLPGQLKDMLRSRKLVEEVWEEVGQKLKADPERNTLPDGSSSLALFREVLRTYNNSLYILDLAVDLAETLIIERNYDTQEHWSRQPFSTWR